LHLTAYRLERAVGRRRQVHHAVHVAHVKGKVAPVVGIIRVVDEVTVDRVCNNGGIAAAILLDAVGQTIGVEERREPASGGLRNAIDVQMNICPEPVLANSRL
jgi:hypothetical protein